jgi:hypothetical protein
VTLNVEKIAGVAGLRAGDRIDLLASIPFKVKSSQGGTLGHLKVGPSAPSGPEKDAVVRVVVENGIVVLPRYNRVETATSHSLTQGARTTAKPVQEIVLAVEPSEVAGLMEVLAVEAVMTAVARSGLPDTSGRDDRIIIPEPVHDEPEKPTAQEVVDQPEEEKKDIIETIVGFKRDVVVFPAVAKSDENN